MLRRLIKPALLLALLAADLLYWADASASRDRAWSITEMPLKFWLMYVALFVAAYIRSTPIRLLFAVALALSAAIVLGAGAVIGTPISFFDFITMVDARSGLPDMYAVHGGTVLWAGLPALLALVGVALPPSGLPHWADGRMARLAIILLPLVAFGWLTKNVHGTQGAVKQHAAPWLGLSYAALYGYESTQGHVGERAGVTLPRRTQKTSRDIVLIVDESVAGPYLDLINPHGERSGLIDTGRPWQVANFGIASSMTNCSMGTNAGLRFGAQRTDYQYNITRAPSIWAFAKQAGLRTVYMYGQRGGRAENYISDAEKLEIDDAVYFEDVAPASRDLRIADVLAERLNNGVPEFILINKYGVHFPLTDIVPDDGQANPNAEGALMIEGPITMGNEASGPEGWDGYREAYRRAVSRSVGGFFDRLSAGVTEAKPPFTLIYTSDHGQQFHERGRPGLLVHCRKDAVMEEGAVPLAVVESGGPNSVSSINWPAAASANRDSKSHFQIFPSLLRAMGYEKDAIRAAYGTDLIDPDKDPLTFASEMYIHFGGEPLWHKIKPECLVMPGAGYGVPAHPECKAAAPTAQ